MSIKFDFRKKLIIVPFFCLAIYLVSCEQPFSINKQNVPVPGVTPSQTSSPTQSTSPSMQPPVAMCSAPPAAYEYYTVNADSTNFNKIMKTDDKWDPNYESINYISYLPDGKNLIFNYSNNSNYKILKYNIETGEKTVLVDNAFGLSNLISPDKTKLIYEKTQNDKNIIFVSDIDGSNQKVINTNSVYSLRNTVWSPDSSKLVNAQNDYNTENRDLVKLYVKDNKGNDFYNFQINGSFNNEYLSWSQDSTKLVYLNNGYYPTEINIFDLQTKVITKIRNDSIPKSYVNWSSDGQKLFYILNQDNKRELYYFDISKNTHTKISDISSYYIWFTKDYKQLIYSLEEGQSNNIYILNTSDLSSKKLTTFNSTEILSSAEWSYDKQKVALTVSTKYQGDKYKDWNNMDLFIINTDGTGKLRLTNSPLSEQEPQWSPDGKQLVFTSNISLVTGCQRELIENWDYEKQ